MAYKWSSIGVNQDTQREFTTAKHVIALLSGRTADQAAMQHHHDYLACKAFHACQKYVNFASMHAVPYLLALVSRRSSCCSSKRGEDNALSALYSNQ
jgi:hypothetical protein